MRLLLGTALAAAVLTGCLAAPPASGAQEEIPVSVKADFFRYDRSTGILTATGHVVFRAGDVLIQADALTANTVTGDLLATGNVLLATRGQSVASQTLSYNFNTERGVLTGAATDYKGPLVIGAVHLRAERLAGVPYQNGTAANAFATTCDEPNPVFYVTGRELTIFANDKIVGHDVSVWVGGRRLFTLPYFIIFLRERRETRLTPVAGYDDVDGYYLKTSYSYYFDSNNYGFLLNDWMQRLGVGNGIEHVYGVNGGTGSILLYRLADAQTQGADVQAILNHYQRVGSDTQARVYLEDLHRTALGQPDLDSLFAILDLSRTTERSRTYWFSTFSSDSTGPSSAITSRFVHDATLSPQVSGEAVLDFSHTAGPGGTLDQLFPRMTLQYLGSGYTASFVAESQPQLDRLPEFTVSTTPAVIGGTPFFWSMDGGFGWYQEPDVTPVRAGRADATVTASGALPAGRGIVGVQAFARGTTYTTGDRRLFYGGRVDYAVPLADGLEARVGYTGQGLVGTSPFQFDQITDPLNLIDAQMTYRAGALQIRTTAAYDFAAQQYQDVITEAIYAPQPNWAIGLASAYNPNIGALDRVEMNVDVRLTPEWWLQYAGHYDTTTQSIVNDQITLTRVFCDCLAVSLSYLAPQNEYWLETWLTAIPWARGRVGVGGRGNLLFNQPIPFIEH
ncbi:MAG TPA: LptA/OstA family protein [bacterium]|nr:LptA/OstA family protein [bacterium]